MLWIVVVTLIVHISDFTYCQAVRQVRLESIVTGEPLIFRKLTYLPSGIFTSSDADGLALLDHEKLTQSTGIMISGFALNDTILDPNIFLEQKTLQLHVKDHIMETVEINSHKLTPITIGHKSPSVREADYAAKSAGFPGESQHETLDMKYGAWVKLPKGKEKYVSKLIFHVGDLLDGQEEWVDIRILGNTTGKKLQPFRIYPMQDFGDLSEKPLNIKISQSGWQELEFQQPVPIPDKNKYILVLFDLLKESDTFTISTQNLQEHTIDRAYYSPPNTIWIQKEPSDKSPAMVVELLLNDKL